MCKSQPLAVLGATLEAVLAAASTREPITGAAGCSVGVLLERVAKNVHRGRSKTAAPARV